MQAYGSVAAPIGHTKHVPLPTSPVGRGLDPFQQLERAHARVSPIRQGPSVDPDAIARLKRLGVLVESEQQYDGAATELVRKKVPKPRTPRAPRQQRESRLDVPGIIAAYQAGSTLAQITEDFGCARNTARRHVQLAGIELRDDRSTFQHARRQRQVTAPTGSADAARIVELYTAGATVKEVAEHLSIGIATVRRRLKAANVAMRDDRSTNSGGQNHLSDHTVAMICELYTAHHLTGKEVAHRLGIGQTSVSRVLRAQGLTARVSAVVQKGRHGTNNAASLRDLMANNGIHSGDVRAWARRTGRAIPGRGLPPRHLVEAYLLLHQLKPAHKEGTPA